ncbi:GNAT family N-acetyltransferase [Lactiplantibacillus pentosus]|uniref:GNAT family N-acetyltransferase n=1 Tax=Lactiplantibacillus pentosus TaxID=1589 RepID=UPI001ADDC79F|nr:GNAT family N-acetyltransferase [Lactiplantibacillus pentosus]MBO9164661.1 GNAT family N-acetyltransferase [Lactiplantibacillus pentosus]MCT3310203.1 GNAT family N-acetyltransferase [Lactiplantibacillus pentosus]
MITIRPADQDDAGQIAPLINMIFDEMQLEELDDIPEPDLEQAITAAYRTPDYLSGKATTVVAEADGQVVGVAFGYPDKNEDAVDDVLARVTADNDAFGSAFEAESYEHEWYLDSIAVDPNYQGHGIGGKLLAALPQYARQAGQQRIGLNVDMANLGAKKLYDRYHYETVGIKPIGDRMYFHMQYELDKELVFA